MKELHKERIPKMYIGAPSRLLLNTKSHSCQKKPCKAGHRMSGAHPDLGDGRAPQVAWRLVEHPGLSIWSPEGHGLVVGIN